MMSPTLAVAVAQPSQRFQSSLADVLARYLAASDLLGRLHAMQTMKAKTGTQPKLNTLSAAGTFDDAGTTVIGFESVPFTRAVDRLRNLTGMTRAAFDGLAQRYRMQAFTVSGLSDVALIDKVRDAVGNAAEQGDTAADFTKAVNQLTTEAGVQSLADFQLTTVFQTNVQRAYANGHFEQMRDPAVAAALPYWKYMTAGDNRVRPNHAALDGFVAQNTDPIWRRIYPPNGFNCRCTVVPILADEAPAEADIPGAARVVADVPDPGFAKGGLAA
jgi:SPP1 gp7 family putative phage head morphogenesis protein